MLKTLLLKLKNKYIIYLLIIFGITFALGIGNIHLFDLDELYFAESTREMLLTKKYGQVSFNSQPLYEKPPLFFWIQALSMQIWGINEVGARFPNVVCGVLTIATLYAIGKQYNGSKFGLLWMCLHATTFLPHFYFKSGIIDPFLNYFMLLAIYLLSHNTMQPSNLSQSIYPIGAGVAIGLALLIKGPIGFVIPLLTLILSRIWIGIGPIRWKQLALALLVAGGIVCCWMIPEVWQRGFIFIKEFSNYHILLYSEPVDTHNQPWYYHYIILFWGCFPSSLFSIYSLKQLGWIRGNYFAANMQALLIVVLLIFTFVGTKIVHYSSMAYFPITFFATNFLYTLFDNHKKINKAIPFLFVLGSICIGCFFLIIPWIGFHKEIFFPFIKNQQIIDALDMPVVWNYWNSIPGLIYLIGIFIALYYFLQNRFIPFIVSSMTANSLSLTLFLTYIAPKIESYSQGELVHFCKACKSKDVYLVTIGFKAAAPLFYADKQIDKNSQKKNIYWFLEGAIDKPCFFILYKNETNILKNYKDIIPIKSAGCFAFYQRLPM